MWRGLVVAMAFVFGVGGAAARAEGTLGYRVLATNATSTLERELNQAAFEGFRFAAMHAGETAFGGSELVVAVERDPEETPWHRFDYVVLATRSTGTMRDELNRWARSGYQLVGQTVFETEFGGAEVIAVMEHDLNGTGSWQYQLLATTRTSTMERELREAGRRGFSLRGLSVGVTSFGGTEVVAFLERSVERDASP